MKIMKYRFLFFLGFILNHLVGQSVDSIVIKQVDSLIQLSRKLTATGDFELALTTSNTAETMAFNSLGGESSSYINCCVNHARVLYFSKELSGSIAWYEKAKSIREKVDGKNTPDYAGILAALAISYEDIGNLEKAEANYVEALEIRKNTLGHDNPRYASSLNNLALFYVKMGRYSLAEPLYLEAMSVREKVLGTQHPDYLYVLHNLGNLYKVTDRYLEAEKLYLKAKEQYENNPAIPRKGYADCLMDLANLYSTMAEYDKAENYFRTSLALREQIYGTMHPEYAAILDNMAGMYSNKGDYEKAEPLFLEALDIREQLHLDKVASLHNLGLLYFYMGNYKKAIELNESVIAIKKSTQNNITSDLAISLNTLANLHYYAYNDFSSAEKHYLEALSIIETTLGKNHSDYASSLENLANLYSEQGKYSSAEQMFKEVLEIRTKELGSNHPEYARGLINLANNYRLEGNFSAADKSFEEAGAILEKKFGRIHPDFASYLKNHGILYLQTGRMDKAVAAFREIASVNKKLLEKSLHHLSEKEISNYLVKLDEIQNQLLTITHQSDLADLIPDCYDYSLFNKGFALNASIRMQKIGRLDTVNARILRQLKSNGMQLANAYSKPILERDSNRIVILEMETNKLEKDLARSIAEFNPSIKQVSWKDIERTLSKEEAAIEFVRYRSFYGKQMDNIYYAALIVRKGSPKPEFIPLFEEKQLVILFQNSTNAHEGNHSGALYASRGANPVHSDMIYDLYDLLWSPMAKYLLDVRKIYYATSGLLYRINIDAIQLPGQDDMLASSYNLVQLGSTRQLVEPDQMKFSSNNALLFGGLKFDFDTNKLVFDSVVQKSSTVQVVPGIAERNLTNRGESWGFLPGTAKEVNEIEALLRKESIEVTCLREYAGTEEAFKSIGQVGQSPRILHMATHGFFFPDPERTIFTSEGVVQDSVTKERTEKSATPRLKMEFKTNEHIFKISEHPMLRSGLILAGGDYAWHTGKSFRDGLEDGILTAYEISQMNLSNTELVVLSACETGLGDIQGNEGVYGLQRAFKIAGVKYIIMSLWQVPDKQTSMLMTTFYKKWLEDKMSIPDAFLAAQKELREIGLDPYQWAGFVLIE